MLCIACMYNGACIGLCMLRMLVCYIRWYATGTSVSFMSVCRICLRVHICMLCIHACTIDAFTFAYMYTSNSHIACACMQCTQHRNASRAYINIACTCTQFVHCMACISYYASHWHACPPCFKLHCTCNRRNLNACDAHIYVIVETNVLCTVCRWHAVVRNSKIALIIYKGFLQPSK